MKNSQQTIFILLTLYVLSVSGVTLYHAFNFTDYVHVKGEETIYYTYFLLVTSILFEGLIWGITRIFHWKAVILATGGNFILSFILGFMIMMVSGLEGFPRHLIFLYGGCFLTIFLFVTVLQVKSHPKFYP